MQTAIECDGNAVRCLRALELAACDGEAEVPWPAACEQHCGIPQDACADPQDDNLGEPNDTPDDAHPVGLDTEFLGTLTPHSPTDHYELGVIPANTVLDVVVVPLPDGEDEALEAVLQVANETILPPPGDISSFSWTSPTAQPVGLRIQYTGEVACEEPYAVTVRTGDL